MPEKAQAEAPPKLVAPPTWVPGERRPDGTSRRRRWRLAAVGLGLAIVSTAVAVGIGELLIRLIAPQQLVLVRADIWQPADSIGWVNRPSVRTQVNTGERTVDYFTDADGFRIGKAVPKRDSSASVLLIGDSFMQALQVEHEHTFAGLLETRLSREVGRDVVVRNAAVAGWDPPQYLIRARGLLARPGWAVLVVTLYTGNDVVDTNVAYVPPRSPAPARALRMPRSFTWHSIVNAWLYPINNWFDEHSELFVFAKNRLTTLRIRLGLSAESVPTELLRSEATSSRWNVTADICLEIHRAAAARGVPALFAIVPAQYQISPERFQQYAQGFRIDTASVDLDQPNRLLGAALRARGLSVVDPLVELRASQQNGARLYGTVDPHFSPEGHDAFEQAVRPRIREILSHRKRQP